MGCGVSKDLKALRGINQHGAHRVALRNGAMQITELAIDQDCHDTGAIADLSARRGGVDSDGRGY